MERIESFKIEKKDIYQFEEYPDDEILNISMAMGLSGTYQSACGARESVDNKENIVVFPNGSFLTNYVYYNDSKGKYITLKDNSPL